MKKRKKKKESRDRHGLSSENISTSGKSAGQLGNEGAREGDPVRARPGSNEVEFKFF